jgi:hypothetical protein
MKKRLLLTMLLFPAVVAMAQKPLGRFSESGLEGWQQKRFDGATRYRLVDPALGRVEAVSEASASALYLPRKVDLEKTPWLNWSWQKRVGIDPGDENARSGDDFVARVYVVKRGGLLFWKTLAINYVWSARHRKGEQWDNPFAGRNARMLALRDGDDPSGRWFREKRNVRDDFRELFGKELRYIDGIAIMTDSDNSRGRAEALYGDLYFTAE